MDHDDGFGWPDDADGPTDDLGGDPSGLGDGLGDEYPDFTAPDDPSADDPTPDDQTSDDGYPQGDVPADAPDEFAPTDGDGLHDVAPDDAPHPEDGPPEGTHDDALAGTHDASSANDGHPDDGNLEDDAPDGTPGDNADDLAGGIHDDTGDDTGDGAPHDDGSDDGSDDAPDEHPGDGPDDHDSFGAGLDTAGDHDATWHPDEFPPELDLGADAPEPLDGYPWSDPQLLGGPEPGDPQDITGAGIGPADPDDLLAYAGLDGGGDNPWSALLASDDPATSALARWWGPTG